MKNFSLLVLSLLPWTLLSQNISETITYSETLIENGDYDSAHQYLHDQLLEFPNHYLLLAAKGEAYLANYESTDAILTFEEAIAAAPDTAQFFRAKHYLNLALAYFDLLAHRESLDWTNLAQETCPNRPSILWNDIMYNKALQFSALNQWDSSLHYFKKVYELDLLRGDSSAIALTLSAIGGQYMYKNEGELARDFYRQSLALRFPKDIRGKAKTINNIGMTFIFEKSYDSAKLYLEKSYHLHESISDTIGMATRLLNLGDNFSRWKKFEEAKSYLDLSEKYFTQMGLKRHLMYVQVSRAIWHKEKGAYKTALKIFEEQLEATRSAGMSRQESRIIKQMVETYQQAGLYQEAFEFQKGLNEIRAQAEKESPLLKLKEIEMTNRIDQKQKELNLLARNKELELANERSSKIFLFVVIGLLLIGFVLFFWMNRQKNKVRQQLLETEIDTLRLRISNIVSDVKLDQIQLDVDRLKNQGHNTLTDREVEILQLAITNKSNQEIADDIFLSVNTVKYHLKNIYAKLGVSTRLEAREAFSQTN
ncbi:LuxR C-terminal-related transcriptional regulator [Reichenbachiella sp.]|uniref:LuxR C-terminal-related transcriptional regulator n=1 Tax=Reichenbachiella sp. TaxID=2184521 RepID=UPI003BB0A69C